MEHTKGCWEATKKNLTSIVNLENDKHCLRLLKLSYNHLPVYLKPCFLYMGVFEEDDEIDVSTLMKLWVFEGFLKPIDGKSLEIIAKEFLNDLVDRNLILTKRSEVTGNINSIKIHDSLRDLCLSEVEKEGFYHVVGQCSPRGIHRQPRVVIRGNTSKKDELQCMSHVRSIICKNGEMPLRCRNLGLLRALNAYDRSHAFRGERMNSFELQQYINLQHLAVEVGSISSIFASVNLLWNLHTLIVSCTAEYSVPAEIWKMPQLRHIEFVCRIVRQTDPPIDGVIMENLHTLKGIHNFKCGEEEVKRIPNIKKLGIQYLESKGMEHDDYCCLSNIKCLYKLESLHIDCWHDFRGNASLHKLTFPHSLKSLTLEMTRDFECEGILEWIGSLPNLEKFKLCHGCFGTGKWDVVEGQFPRLKYLELSICNNLKQWRAEIEESSIFPLLERVYLFCLEELEEIPSEIGDVPTLQKIWLYQCNESAVMCAKKIVDEQVEQQGDELPFYVLVGLEKNNEALKSLASPNFEVYIR